MRADERLDPKIGFPLAKAMEDNQGWLAIAEAQVGGDVEKACDLVGMTDCPEPEAPPGEQRMAAYLILLLSQKEWFGQVRTSPKDLEGYSLANVSVSGLILMRSGFRDTTTLLEATPGTDKQVRVIKTMYNYDENIRLTNLPVTKEDALILEDTTRRLCRVNRKWRQLLKEHFGPTPHHLIPHSRTASEDS